MRGETSLANGSYLALIFDFVSKETFCQIKSMSTFPQLIKFY